MKQAAKPAGVLVVLDYNHTQNQWQPDPPRAFKLFYDAFLAWRHTNHWDNEIADHLPELFRSAGLVDVESRVQEVSQISRSLKILARDLDVPILAMSQLSRAVEQRHDKRPILSDLRESGSIEQDADLVMFIYRDEYYNDESDQQGIAEVHLAKHRNGPTDTVKLSFLKRYAKFADLAPSS
jgi:replicative DNA helicase